MSPPSTWGYRSPRAVAAKGTHVSSNSEEPAPGQTREGSAEEGQALVDGLVRLMDLETLDLNLFRSPPTHEPRPRVFGGQVAAHALVAATRSVAEPDRTPHSLHAYFLRPGDPSVPIIYEVDRIRDGRSFTTRRIVAIQGGEAIFNMSVSFHRKEEGLTHQAPMPDVKPPEECVTWAEYVEPWVAGLRKRNASAADYIGRRRAIAMRPVEPMDLANPQPMDRTQHFWIRADGTLPDDPSLHAAIATFASDHSLLSVAMRPHGRMFNQPTMMAASLDHAIWFHHPFRMDEWLLYAQESPAASAGRGLAFGHYYTSDGQLVASMCQEGLMRVVERRR